MKGNSHINQATMNSQAGQKSREKLRTKNAHEAAKTQMDQESTPEKKEKKKKRKCKSKTVENTFSPNPVSQVYSLTSSSLPGNTISHRITANTWFTKTNSHMATIHMDMADPTPLIALLSNALARVIVASVNPVLGKTIAHQLKWNAVGGARTTAISAMQKNHKLRAQRNAPAARAKVSSTCLSDALSGRPITPNESGNPRAMPMSASAVNAGGPTQMNMPGRCSRFGRPDSINLPM